MAREQDHYHLLGIRSDATPTQIRSAYRRAARAHHPDLNPGDTDAADRFKRVQEAYEVLSDPNRRAAYDRPAPSPSPPTWTGGSYNAAWGAGPPPSATRRPGTANRAPPPEVGEALLMLRAIARQVQFERRLWRLVRYLEGL